MNAEVAANDAFVATATGHAARTLEWLSTTGDGHLVERDLSHAMTTGLEVQRRRVVHEARYLLPTWHPQPGGVDLSVSSACEARMALVELKWANQNSIYEALWDAVKLVDATHIPEVVGVYLCYGATEARWTKPAECAEIFETGVCKIVDLIKQHADWWERYILGDSTGRPMSAPESVDVLRISDVGLSVAGKPWRLRTVRLRAAGPRVPFIAGRPA